VVQIETWCYHPGLPGAKSGSALSTVGARKDIRPIEINKTAV